MKFTLNKINPQTEYWNGKKSLPDEINVISSEPLAAEIELLAIICKLHGYMTGFDLLTGADTNTEKDKDINAVMVALQMYIYPKMPVSNYTSSDKRQKVVELSKLIPNSYQI